MLGILNTTAGLRSWRAPAASGMAVMLLGLAVLGITVRDYLRVETSFFGLRFEVKNIPTSIPRTPPEIVALTQWSRHIEISRLVPQRGMARADIDRMREVVMSTPSAYVMFRLASILALNGQPQEATVWLRRVCQVSPQAHCDAIRAEWARLSTLEPLFAALPWPELTPSP